jgi:tetratricopeptide (TPR) repeat protein
MDVEIEYYLHDEFEKSKWITLEDANVEHLLNVFASVDGHSNDGISKNIWKACVNSTKHLFWHKQRKDGNSDDGNSKDVWKACANFMKHLYWHKQRKTVLGPRVEALPDSHRFKASCLFELSRVLQSIGSDAERVGLLSRAIEKDLFRVGLILLYLSGANLELGHYEEGLKQAKEALAIAEANFGDVAREGCLNLVA